MTNDAMGLVEVLKVLGDESRLKILALLIDREASVEELAAALSLKTPTVSHHLGRLKSAALVDMRSEGNVHLYRFRREALTGLLRRLDPERLKTAAPVAEGAWERKVLRDFLNGEELKEIPASRKKRQVILQWLVEKFAVGTRYPEAEVNQIIGRHHPDFATLRRELIASRLMQRQDGQYWRMEQQPAPPER